MGVTLLNLISTPVPVLNSLGLNLRLGLSSEDPQVVNPASEPFQAFLTIFSPEGLLLGREYLGEIPPHRRKYFDVSPITRKFVPELDHLTVVHRIPSRLLAHSPSLEDEINVRPGDEFRMYRTLIEYSYPQGGNGAVIYETTPGLNTSPGSNNLTFTNQIALSGTSDTHVVVINYSMNPSYSHMANYDFAVHSYSGQRAVSAHVAVGPFSIKVLDMAQVIPKRIIETEQDLQDGLSMFTLVGCSGDTALPVVIVNTTRSTGAVAIEHTNVPQGFLFPYDLDQMSLIKADAVEGLKTTLSEGKVTYP